MDPEGSVPAAETAGAAGEDAAPANSSALGASSGGDAEATAGDHTHREVALAARNFLKLAMSLVLTWGVALIVTFKLPSYLGPEAFGHYKFGDQLAMSLAVFLTLGVDTYISREVPVRPKHASDFFGGVLLVRAAAIVPLVVFAIFFLDGAAPDRRVASLLFGCAYLFTSLNRTFQQTLEAASTVGRLALANVIAKVLWGGGTLVALMLGAPLWVLPLPLVASEALKAGFLYYVTRRAIELRVRVDLKATIDVLKVAFPFYVANLAVSLGSSIDVVMLGKIVSEDSSEVGWYGSARQIAQLSALLSPILSGVLIPMLSRTKARSEDEFFVVLRRGIEGVIVVALPLTLMLALGAEFWIHIALGDAFLPAAPSLRFLTPTFVLAYGNVLLWVALMILDRSWTIMIVSIAGLVLLPILVFAFVPLTSGLGDGGAGMGTAIAISTRELIVVLVFLAFLGRRALDRRAVLAILKSVVICAIVTGAHVAMRSLGPVRLVGDAALYGLLALGLGVLRPSDVKAVLRMIKNRKRAEPT